MKKTFLIIFCLIVAALASSVWAFNDAVQVNYNDGIYHIVLDGKKICKRIKFVSSDKLVTNKEAHQKSQSLLTINAGYFDPKNQKTISYIVTDGHIVADPLFNENLMANPVIRQNMDKVINRTEFRVIECDGKYHYEIVPHNTPVDFACNISTSAQGGPMILPELKMEEEFFTVTKDGKVTRESASVLHKTARTIIGLKGDDIHILIITDKNPKTLPEVQDFCKKLNLDRAMSFDGGSSTSMNYKKEIEVTSTKDSGGRMLKSFMLVGK